MTTTCLLAAGFIAGGVTATAFWFVWAVMRGGTKDSRVEEAMGVARYWKKMYEKLKGERDVA